MSNVLSFEFENAELTAIDNFEKPLSAQSQKLYNELLEATKTSGKTFTKLAYKAGESAMRNFLANNSPTMWEDYMDALAALGPAGRAVKALAMQVFKYICGGRTPDKESGYYFAPSMSWFYATRVEGVTVYELAPKTDEERKAALEIARTYKGKLFNLEMKREPHKAGPLDSMAKKAREVRFLLAGTDKKDASKRAKVRNQLADSGLSEKDFDKVLAFLSKIKVAG